MHPPESLRPISFPPNLTQPVNPNSPWLRSYLQANVDWFRFRVAIAGMDVAFGRHGIFWGILWLQQVWSKATLGLGLTKENAEEPKNSEEDIDMQQQMVDMAKELGVEIDENVFRG
jgi:hypothetical protein